PAVRAEDEAFDAARVPAHLEERPPGREVPEDDRAIGPPGGESPTVRAEGHAPDRRLMPTEGDRGGPARADVPRARGPIETARGESEAVPREVHLRDVVFMPIEFTDLPAFLDVPEVDRRVRVERVARGEEPAVEEGQALDGAEDERIDGLARMVEVEGEDHPLRTLGARRPVVDAP